LAIQQSIMNKILYIFLFLCSQIIVNAQGYILENLQSNQKINHIYLQNEAEIKNQTEALGYNIDFKNQGIPEANCPDTIIGKIYINSGDSKDFKIDTSRRRAQLRDISQLSNGVLTKNGSTFTYKSNPGLDLAFDLIRIERKDSTLPDRDTLTFDLTIKRKGITELMPTQYINPQSVNSFCYKSSLPGGINCTKFEVADKNYGLANIQDSCLVYRSTRFGNTNIVTIIVCNKYATCDTIIYNLKTNGDTLKLPFFDDFSYEGPYPDIKLWLDDNVFINNQMTKNQPSWGVATFDAIDPTGTPYSLSTFPSSTDVLTSNFLDLSGLTKDNKIGLSFYLQPKGLCYAANVEDSMVVQFKDYYGNWNSIKSYPGLPKNYSQDNIPDFTRYLVSVDSSIYFYKGFQFRFVTYGRPNGIYEIWHLDYVLLDKNLKLSDGYPDLSFSDGPRSILENYNSMPWNQFKPNISKELTSNLSVSLFNHFNKQTNASRSEVSLFDSDTKTNLVTPFVLINTNNYDPNTFYSFNNSNLDLSVLASSLSTLPNKDKRSITTQYLMEVGSAQKGIPAFRNDTIKYKTIFDNYFAYDDGTAEIQYTMQGNAVTTAVEFNANIGDTLKAVRMFFPHINGDGRNQLFNLKVWKDSLNTIPIFDLTLRKTIYTDDLFDTLQGYTTYQIYDKVTRKVGVFVPKGKFFVGYQNASGSTTNIPIGLDKNNQSGQHTFVNLKPNEWTALNIIKGSLMIRPVLGSESPFTTSSNDVSESYSLKLYPNPAHDQIMIDMEDYSNKTIEIYNTMGSLILKTPLEKNTDIHKLTPGLYIIKVKDLTKTINFVSKFIKQ
jgi:hypothetical protein